MQKKKKKSKKRAKVLSHYSSGKGETDDINNGSISRELICRIPHSKRNADIISVSIYTCVIDLSDGLL